MTEKQHCETCPPHRTTFCPACGKADKVALKRVRLMGLVGVQHSNSPSIAEFWESGDPAVFSRPDSRPTPLVVVAPLPHGT